MSDTEILTGDDLIARVTEHFKSFGLRKIIVPEWKSTIYFTPITVNERQNILKDGALGGPAGGYISAIIAKALNAKGEKLFSLMHENTLRNGAYSPVVEKVANILMAVREPDPEPLVGGETPEERAEKN